MKAKSSKHIKGHPTGLTGETKEKVYLHESMCLDNKKAQVTTVFSHQPDQTANHQVLETDLLVCQLFDLS